MDNCHKAGRLRVATAKEPIVPFGNFGQQGRSAGAGHLFVFGSFIQPRYRKARNRRLGDARGRHRPPRAPDIGAGKIAIVQLVKDDMGHHAVFPLVFKQRLYLGPGAAFIKMGLAQGGQATVPVPLKRIKAVGWHRVAALVIFAQNFGCVVKKGLAHV